MGDTMNHKTHNEKGELAIPYKETRFEFRIQVAINTLYNAQLTKSSMIP